MKKNAIAFAVAAGLVLGASAAAASGNNNTGGNSCRGNCPSGGGSINTDIKNTNIGVNKNYNTATSNNYNNNVNDNYNKNENKNYNTNNNTNQNQNANNNSNTNDNNNQNNSAATATSDANANASSSSGGGDGGSSNVSIGGDEAAASSAAPVYLTSSNDTCMGSSGIGGQGMSFGFSLGTTWTDSNCIMLKNARELKVQGHEKAAKARLCMDEDNALAFELAGEPCPRALGTSRAAIAKVREYQTDYMAASTAAIPVAVRTARGRTVAARDSLE